MNNRLVYTSGLAIIVALGGFLLGFDFSVIAGVLPFIKDYFTLNEWALGFTATVISLGTIPGTFSAGPIIDLFGRKKILIVCALLYAVSAVTSALATDFTFFNIARVIGGLAIGASIITAPVYVAEISPPEYRGRLVGINQFTIVLGISVAYFSNYFLLPLEHNWRWMLGVEAFPAMLYFIFLFLVPESPRWLVMKGRIEQAKNVLLKFAPEKEAESELTDIHNSLLHHDKVRYAELFHGKVLVLLGIAIVLGICQQMSGVNVVFSYAPMIFKQSGAGTQAAFVSAVFVGLVNLLSTVVAIWLMDKVGRRPLLLTGAAGMTLSHISLTLAFWFKLQGALVLIPILSFIAFFAMSMGPGYWIVASEIMPNRVRGLGISIIQGITNAASMLVVFFFPWAEKNFGLSGAFLAYSFVTLFTFFFVFKVIPETKGKSLEEIEVALGVRE